MFLRQIAPRTVRSALQIVIRRCTLMNIVIGEGRGEGREIATCGQRFVLRYAINAIYDITRLSSTRNMRSDWFFSSYHWSKVSFLCNQVCVVIFFVQFFFCQNAQYSWNTIIERRAIFVISFVFATTMDFHNVNVCNND